MHVSQCPLQEPGVLSRHAGRRDRRCRGGEKAKIIVLTRLMRREIRRDGLNREDGRKLIEACRAELVGLLPRVESLTF